MIGYWFCISLSAFRLAGASCTNIEGGERQKGGVCKTTKQQGVAFVTGRRRLRQMNGDDGVGSNGEAFVTLFAIAALFMGKSACACVRFAFLGSMPKKWNLGGCI